MCTSSHFEVAKALQGSERTSAIMTALKEFDLEGYTFDGNKSKDLILVFSRSAPEPKGGGTKRKRTAEETEQE